MLSQKEAESSYLAYHYSLTALPNWQDCSIDRFRQASFHAIGHEEQVTLLLHRSRSVQARQRQLRAC